MVDTIVRPASDSDRDEIWRFLRDAYGPLAPYKASERWDWQFADNPYHRRGAPDRLPIFVAAHGDRIVGQIAAQAVPMQVGDETYKAAWAVDVMVLPSHRGGGIGHRLFALGASEFDLFMLLNMAPATRRMAEKAGCVPIGPVYKHSRWDRLDRRSLYRYLMKRTVNWPKLRRLVRLGCSLLFLDRVFPLVVNPLLALRDTLSRSSFEPLHHEIEEVLAFGHDIDELWSAARHDFTVICPRDSAYLNWRFVKCPQMSYRCFVARRAGSTRGYVVLRNCQSMELPLGVIVDLFARRGDRDAIEDLVRHSLKFFRNEVASVECATNVPEYRSVLRRFGFFVTRVKHPNCVSRSPEIAARLGRLENEWFLSMADHDWDQIDLA